MNPSRICVIGSVNMDLVVRTPRIPSPGETVLGGNYRTFAGGKGANQAAAASRMGAAVTLIAAIGDDAHGTKVRAALDAEKIDLARMLVRPGESTGLALITVADGGENTIVVSPGANATLTADDVKSNIEAIAAADVLLMQLEIPTLTVHEAARIARDVGRAVILNAAPARSLPKDLMKLVDVLIVNRTEAAILLGLDPSLDPARLALRLPELGPVTILLTLGSQGAMLLHRGRLRRVPTLEIKAVDAVGAGDAFAGALAACWSRVQAAIKGKSADEMKLVEEAAATACVAGALATTRVGAMPSLPRAEDVLPHVGKMRVGG